MRTLILRGSFKYSFGVCLHVPTPSPSLPLSPSKFDIVLMVMGSLSSRMGDRPILPVKLPITVDLMLNFDRDSDSGRDVVLTSKQTFTQSTKIPRTVNINVLPVGFYLLNLLNLRGILHATS